MGDLKLSYFNNVSGGKRRADGSIEERQKQCTEIELGVSEIMEDSDRICERNENGKGNEWKNQLKIFSYRVQITI